MVAKEDVRGKPIPGEEMAGRVLECLQMSQQPRLLSCALVADSDLGI